MTLFLIKEQYRIYLESIDDLVGQNY